MKMKNNRMWVWGYVLDQVPGTVPFVPKKTWCSLETAVSYLGADNAVFMNSCTDLAELNDGLFAHLDSCKQVVCGLQHGKYLESAAAVSRFSLTHPNVTGAVIDDFLDTLGDYYRGPSADMTPAELQAVRDALRSANPDLKLYVVRYTRQDPAALLPYLPYFDVLNLWVWGAGENFWYNDYVDTVARYRLMYGKEILQGLFVHQYGPDEDWATPMPENLMASQVRAVGNELRKEHIGGWCFLQNGWFCRETHRETMQALKSRLDWFYGTTTFRNW